MEHAGEEETEPPTGRIVHETARVLKLLAGTAVALPVAVRSQQPSIWTIESFNISREPCADLHVDVCIDCAFFVASGVTAPEHQPEWSIAAITERWAREWRFVLPQRGVICDALDPPVGGTFGF
jgi:hypothetical protein